MIWALFFDKLLENVQACVMVADDKGRTAFANTRCLNSFGLNEEGLIGSRWLDVFIPEEARPGVSEVFDKVKKEHDLLQFTAPVLKTGTEDGFFCWTIIPLREREKTPYFILLGRKGECPAGGRQVLAQDITSDIDDLAYKEVIDTIFKAIRIYDPPTAEHAFRVMKYAVSLARELGVSPEKVERIKVASLLHDVGKIAVDHDILYKEEKLNKAEFEKIKEHLKWGFQILRLISCLEDIALIMVDHHEGYDGGGYPHGIRGPQIPLEARILTVADIYEALTSDRPYRKAFSKEEAEAIMEYEKGYKLDPELTEIFLEMVKKKKILKNGTSEKETDRSAGS